MKFSNLLAATAAATMVDFSFAYPGMRNMASEIKQAVKDKRDEPVEMIGDLAKGATTPVGKLIQSCLLGEIDCYDDVDLKTYVPPGALGSVACNKDTCCVWEYLGRELHTLFVDANGQCNQNARAAIRLGFHEAGPWSKTSGYGGADGSFLLNPIEYLRPENKGLEAIRQKALELLAKYAIFGVGAADLAQFMAKFAIVSCPLGPRVRTFVGRDNTFLADPPNLMPDVHSPSSTLIKLFADKTINAEGLAALVGAHSTSNQFFVDTSKAGFSQDSTPGVWDMTFYNETLANKPAPNVFRFPSDLALAADPATSPAFKDFANGDDGQEDWNEEFSKAYVRLSLLGVNKINQLTDCTKVMPNQIESFP